MMSSAWHHSKHVKLLSLWGLSGPWTVAEKVNAKSYLWEHCCYDCCWMHVQMLANLAADCDPTPASNSHVRMQLIYHL